jgi:hypothetical protein
MLVIQGFCTGLSWNWRMVGASDPPLFPATSDATLSLFALLASNEPLANVLGTLNVIPAAPIALSDYDDVPDASDAPDGNRFNIAA